ncbi:unnamed protein product [Leptidea sinapis]|uniref:THAP-type domain-containing protein n=1 Tax=Leptidea sinapis TaxID=189913 RepID=A0A5E4Q299_9NEOP|nr:unnamed protein product [Leptidea sinapis]
MILWPKCAKSCLIETSLSCRVPSDRAMRNRWITIIRSSREEQKWKPSARTCICSEHFRDNDFYRVTATGPRRLKKSVIPTQALFFASLKHNGEESAGNDSDDSSTDITIEEIHFEEDSSDLDSVYDTPKESKLRRELRRKIARNRKHLIKIEKLQRKHTQVKTRVCELKSMIKELKKKKKKNADWWDDETRRMVVEKKKAWPDVLATQATNRVSLGGMNKVKECIEKKRNEKKVWKRFGESETEIGNSNRQCAVPLQICRPGGQHEWQKADNIQAWLHTKTIVFMDLELKAELLLKFNKDDYIKKFY